LNTVPRCGGIEPATLDRSIAAGSPHFYVGAHRECLLNELMFIIHRVIAGNLTPSAGLILKRTPVRKDGKHIFPNPICFTQV
jgi:hypothetical protein